MVMLTGAALAAPSLLRAQQKRIPKVAVILAASAAEGQPLVKVFESAWPALGWVNGKTVQIDYRFAAPALLLAEVIDMVASAPDVILVNGLPIVSAARRATQTIPTVFVGVSDPEGQGFVASLARPGGNMTGFANFEPSIGGKWLETLKEAAPQINRVRCAALSRDAADDHARHRSECSAARTAMRGLRDTERGRAEGDAGQRRW